MDYLEKHFENLECIILVAEAIARAENIK
jgi:hypothetical protein